MEYIVGIRVPLGKFVDKIQKMDDSINKSMARFGFDDGKIVTTSVVYFDLRIPDETSIPELEKIKNTICEKAKDLYGYAAIESFERKP